MISLAALRRLAEWTVGVTLVLLGIAGLVLPGLQGILLILAGLAVLSSHSRLAKRLLEAIKAKLHAARERLRR